MSVTKVAPPHTSRRTEGPTFESRTLRGVWFGLLFSLPVWLFFVVLLAALI